MDRRTKCIKLLEDNIGEKLDDYRYVNYFSDITPKTWAMKETTDIPDFIKILKFLLYERQCQENEKANHRFGEKYLPKIMSDKELKSKIYNLFSTNLIMHSVHFL